MSPSKETEMLLGANRGIVRQIMGRTHAMTSNLKAVRAVRLALRQPWRSIPRPLRRGPIATVILEHAEDAALYREVMS
jgi:hypothetical protein